MQSDWQSLASYYLYGPESLGRAEMYKACVAAAVHGASTGLESSLSTAEKQLLGARRLMFAGKLEEAKQDLSSLDLQSCTNELKQMLSGDRSFLMGVITQRAGSHSNAKQFLGQATESLKNSGDLHRFLRNEVNRAICNESLSSFMIGRLYFLYKEVSLLHLYDLVGAIRKAHASQLMDEGQFSEAEHLLVESVEAYSKDGSAEDESVAKALLAICRLNLGDPLGAKAALLNMRATKGKVAPYLDIYDSLLSGKKPKVPKGHPLHECHWSLSIIRPNAVSSKIVRALSDGGKTSEQIIHYVWGERANHPSYKDRLHSAIRQLRRQNSIPVHFDGEQYQLIR